MGSIAKNPLGSNSWLGKGVGSVKNLVTGKGNIGDLLNVGTYGSYKGTGINNLVNGAVHPNQSSQAKDANGNLYPDAFQFNPDQAAVDQQSINDLANQQYADVQQYNTTDQSNRASARQALADALTKQSQAFFQQGLPQTEETLNAQHLLNGSGLGQEIGRQQAYLGANIANQVGTLGATDINRASDINLQALQGQQGQQQAALSRGLSLQDFARQAQIAKAIGATAAPQMPSGKSTGIAGGLAGAGAGATIGSAVPVVGTGIGALLGGAAGYYGGSQAYGRGK